MSRSGSHAGRGFHYQDAIGVWLLVKSWAGELPYGKVTPEGRDDYEVDGVECSALIQVKSRRNHLGEFSVSEVTDFIKSLWDKVKSTKPPKNLILILERPVVGKSGTDFYIDKHLGLTKSLCASAEWQTLSPLTRICVVDSPFESAYKILERNVPCMPLVAQVYYSELLKRVSKISDDNGLIKNGEFNSITISDLEEAIHLLEPLINFSEMERALREGYCAAVDFLTVLDDPYFYEGVNARPGHIAAGLIIERPTARADVISALEHRGAVLITGASGTGKSSLMWEAASWRRHSIRWFEIKMGSVADVHLFTRLAQSLRASVLTPIGFTLDDIGRGLVDLWNKLVVDFSMGCGVFLLGTIREEDIFLLTARASAVEIRSNGGSAIAEKIWKSLHDQRKTEWSGWREPWMLSNGLLLEYTHILTRGNRLKTVLGEQIDRRIRDRRDEEIAILRITALANSAGAEVDITQLARTLGISCLELAIALKRLTDEHLVSEPISGKIKGLHQLRSSMIFDLICETLLFSTLSDTVIESINSVVPESIKLLIGHVWRKYPDQSSNLIKNVAVRIERECDPDVAVSALSGFGQIYIEMTLERWLPEAYLIGIEPTKITLAVLLAVGGVDTDVFSINPSLKSAVLKLRELSSDDPRLSLLSILSPLVISAIFRKTNIKQLQSLLATLVEVNIPEYFLSALIKIKPDFDKIDIIEAADLLSAARLIDPSVAFAWIEDGILERLLARVSTEIPWTAPVQVSIASEGRLLRSLVFHVVESVQKDVHEEVVQLCQILFGIDPTAEIVAVDAIAADRLPSGAKNAPIATKYMPRKNLPPSILVKWNRNWTYIATGLVGPKSYSSYLASIKSLLGELIPTLERVIDYTLRNKEPQSKIMDKLAEIHKKSNSLTPPQENDKEIHNKYVSHAQHVLFNCSSELIRKFWALPKSCEAFIFWSKNLIEDVNQVRNEPWELVEKSPDELLQHLEWIIESLCRMAVISSVSGSSPRHLWFEKTKKAKFVNALRAARASADEMLRLQSQESLRNIKEALSAVDVCVEVHVRIGKDSLLSWPSLDVLIIKDIECLDCWYVWVAEKGPFIHSVVNKNQKIWIVPRINDLVVSRLTMGFGSTKLINQSHLIDDWLNKIHINCLNDSLTSQADQVISLISQLDGFRVFNLGVENRPPFEKTVRNSIEQELLEDLLKFEKIAIGTTVQMLLRNLNEEVFIGNIALAESIAAFVHDEIRPDMMLIMGILSKILSEDIAIAVKKLKTNH